MVAAVFELIFVAVLLICKAGLLVCACIAFWHSNKVEDKQDKIIDLLHAILYLLVSLGVKIG